MQSFLQHVDIIANVGVVAVTAFTYIFAAYFKKSWSDSQKLKEAVYVRELLETKKSLQLILNDINREEQPVFYAKIESLFHDINNEVTSYATSQENSLQLQNILKGDFKLQIFKNTYRNWVDVLTAFMWGFICWAFWLGISANIVDEYLKTPDDGFGVFTTMIFVVTTLSTLLATSYSYKKFYNSSGFVAWCKKNILFGIYCMLFAAGYITVFVIVLNLYTS